MTLPTWLSINKWSWETSRAACILTWQACKFILKKLIITCLLQKFVQTRKCQKRFKNHRVFKVWLWFPRQCLHSISLWVISRAGLAFYGQRFCLRRKKATVFHSRETSLHLSLVNNQINCRKCCLFLTFNSCVYEWGVEFPRVIYCHS